MRWRELSPRVVEVVSQDEGRGREKRGSNKDSSTESDCDWVQEVILINPQERGGKRLEVLMIRSLSGE